MAGGWLWPMVINMRHKIRHCYWSDDQQHPEPVKANSSMHYPVRLTEIQEGLSLYLPDPDRIRSTYEHLLAKDPATAFPFWAQVWPSAMALSAFLQEAPQWAEGKKVLEIGAGIGIPSFLIARYAANVLISDQAPEAVALIEKNIQYLGLKHARALCLDWNALPDTLAADIVLLSDINYAPDQFEALLHMIKNLLQKGCTLLLATPQRITIAPFAEAIQPFIRTSVLQNILHLGQTVEIRILVLSN